jgi:hypothetical protein
LPSAGLQKFKARRIAFMPRLLPRNHSHWLSA